MLAFQRCFEAWKQKKVGGSQVRAVQGLGDRWHPCFNQVVCYDEGTVGRRIIVVQLSVVCDVRPDALNPSFRSFEDFHIKFSVHSGSRFYKLVMNQSADVKKKRWAWSWSLICSSWLSSGEGTRACATPMIAFWSPGHIQIPKSRHL